MSSVTAVMVEPTGDENASVNTLKQLYVIGYPIAKSKSPVMHNTAYQSLEIPYNMSICETKTLDSETIDKIRAPNFGGAAVTMPFKLDIMPYLDSISPMAQLLGAVNTVIPGPQGKLSGDNTDWIGILNVLRKGLKPEHNFDTNVPAPGLVIGAGGAARAGVYALMELGCKPIYIYNRSVDKIASIAAALPAAPLKHVTSLRTEAFDEGLPIFVVGTLPASVTTEDALAQSAADGKVVLTQDIFSRPQGGVMLDMAYLPRNTPLVSLAAKANDWSVNPGIFVLIQQAYPQFKSWTGQDAPEEIMSKACLDAYEAEFGA